MLFWQFPGWDGTPTRRYPWPYGCLEFISRRPLTLARSNLISLPSFAFWNWSYPSAGESGPRSSPFYAFSRILPLATRVVQDVKKRVLAPFPSVSAQPQPVSICDHELLAYQRTHVVSYGLSRIMSVYLCQTPLPFRWPLCLTFCSKGRSRSRFSPG